MRRRELGQAPANLGGRLLRGLAVHVRAARRRGRRRVGHAARIGCVVANPADADAELVGNDLRHLDVKPLPHLGSAVIEVHGAVLVNMHERARLVEVRRRE